MILPKYPIYIITKGRWMYNYTAKALESMNCPYYLCVEPKEYENYYNSEGIDKNKIIILPENFSERGYGSIPVRNWVWEDSIKKGFERHWILDDNIRDFRYYYNKKKYLLKTPACFRIIEDYVDNYENIAMAGMQYNMFCVAGAVITPFIKNTRIYSCILIKNDIPFRWRGRYNEDTDLSLRVLKAGYCTLLFYMFVCKKVATMTLKGGNTDTIYKDGIKSRYQMSWELYKNHPDVVKITYKFHRWHHQVNYNFFKNNKFILKKDAKKLNYQDIFEIIKVNEEIKELN